MKGRLHIARWAPVVLFTVLIAAAVAATVAAEAGSVAGTVACAIALFIAWTALVAFALAIDRQAAAEEAAAQRRARWDSFERAFWDHVDQASERE